MPQANLSQPLYSFSNNSSYFGLSISCLPFVGFGAFLVLSTPSSSEFGILMSISFGALSLVSLAFGLAYSKTMSFYADHVWVKSSANEPEEIPYSNITSVGIVPNESSRRGYYLKVVFDVRGEVRRYQLPRQLLYHNPQLPDPQVDGESLASWLTKKAALLRYEDEATGKWSHQRDNLL